MQGKNNPLLSSVLEAVTRSPPKPLAPSLAIYLGSLREKIQSCLFPCFSRGSRRIVDGLHLQIPLDEGSHHQNNSKWSIQISDNTRRDN
jgi:hypothetical protein